MEWITNQRGHDKVMFDGEVVVTEETIRNRKKYCFKFRKNSFCKIVSNVSENIMMATEGTKVYFKGTSSRSGFALSRWGLDSKAVRVPAECLSDLIIGEYNLEFDSKEGLCYIDLNRKLEKSLNWFGKE